MLVHGQVQQEASTMSGRLQGRHSASKVQVDGPQRGSMGREARRPLRRSGALVHNPWRERAMLAPIVAFLLLTGGPQAGGSRRVLGARRSPKGPLNRASVQEWPTALYAVIGGRPKGGGAGKGHTPPRNWSCRRHLPLVFCQPHDGKAFHSVYASWDLARISVGLRDVRMHDLRHS